MSIFDTPAVWGAGAQSLPPVGATGTTPVIRGASGRVYWAKDGYFGVGYGLTEPARCVYADIGALRALKGDSSLPRDIYDRLMADARAARSKEA